MPIRARLAVLSLATIVTALSSTSCGRPLDTHLAPGSGTLAVQLSDAAFLVEEVRRADVFLVRIDTRLAGADSATAARGLPDDSAGTGGWTTVVSPNTLVNLLDYQYQVTLPLGDAPLAAGSYRGFRLVIDPSRSSLTLVNGIVLTNAGGPDASALASARSGIRIFLVQPMIVREGETTTVRVDFAGDEHFTVNGTPIANSALVFRPILRGAVQASGVLSPKS
jgi:hypothetical protein